MKRLITSLILLAGSTGIAGAHTLAGGDGLLAQLDHQLLGVYHLPLTVLLIVIGVILLRRWRAVKKP
jgi:hypothetical protein